MSGPLLYNLFQIANRTLNSVQLPIDISISIAFEPVPTAMTKHGAGTNVLGMTPLDGAMVILLLSISWTQSSSMSSAEDIGGRVVDAMDAAAQKWEALHAFRYMNYAHPDQRSLESYGLGNIEFLRNVSLRYDPRGLFQTRVPGGFKLGI